MILRRECCANRGQMDQMTMRADLLTLPLLSDPSNLKTDDIATEIDNNAQGLLGSWCAGLIRVWDVPKCPIFMG